MPKAVLITSHFWNSKRKAGFHNIGEALVNKGYEILFLTGNASYIHHLKGDYRAALINKTRLNELERIDDNVNQFIRFTKIHPVNYRIPAINTLLLPSIKKYAEVLKGFNDVNEFIGESELFIFESFPGLLWFDHFKKLNPKARFVYRVSDDMRQLNKHQYVIDHEMKIVSQFDLVSVPSEYIFNIFKGKANVKLQYHGIRKDLFDNAGTNPYPEGSINYVFTGNSYLDQDFLRRASGLQRDDTFNIMGPFERKVNESNVKYFGEMIYGDTIPYIKFADAGLHSLSYTKGAESFSDSLKVIQYTYCKLPVIAPDFIKSKRANFIHYKPGDSKSIGKALDAAKKFDRSSIDISGINTWDELAEKLIHD